MSLSVYTASKPRHAAMWREIRAAGINVIATWIDFENDRDIDCFQRLWIQCAHEAAQADVTLLYIEPHDELRGAYVEMGIALASGKRVYLVNPHNVKVTDAVSHPRVTVFTNLRTALDAIRLGQ